MSAPLPPYRRFCIVFATVHGLLLAGTLSLNVIADPQDVFGAVSPESLASYRNHRTRIAKAARLSRGGIDVVLVGTSRTEAGLDPADAAWGEGVVYNAGLGGGNLYEANFVADSALDAGRPRTLILTVDLLGLNSSHAAERTFDSSYFSPRFDPLAYWAGSLLGRGALERSWKVVLGATRGEKGSNRPDGFRREREGAEPLQHRRLFEIVLRSFFVEGYNGFDYDPARIEHLGRVLKRARRAGVEAIVVVSPVHALQLEAMRLAGLGDQFERLERDLVGIADEANREEGSGSPVAVWDFTGYAGRLAEPVPPEGSATQMRWFVESSHFTSALGHEIAARVRGLAEADPSFGVRLQAASLEEHLARRRREREDYSRRAADEVAWVESVFRGCADVRTRARERSQALRAASRR